MESTALMLGNLPMRVGFAFSMHARIQEFWRTFHQSFLHGALVSAGAISLVKRETLGEQALRATD
jgi:hypothetical protein